MSSLIRWEPLGELLSLRDVADRLLEDAFVRPSFSEGFGTLPALDLYEDANDVVVKASVPGVKPEDIKVTVEGNVLRIEGESKAEEHVEKRNYVFRERRSGRFVRSVSLPAGVDADKAKAEFEHGVLTLTIPKKEEARTKTIQVRAK
jgi:HSP20 family protein